jgi:chitinase
MTIRTNQRGNFALRPSSLLRSAILIAAALVPFAASAQIPAKVLGCYWTAWDTTFALTDVPLDFNVIFLFTMGPAGGGGTNTGDGSFSWGFQTEVPNATIQAVRNRGQKVILTIGGAGLGFYFSNRTQSTNFVNSAIAAIDQMGGVDGMDFNNFEQDHNRVTSPTEMVWIAQQLRARYGPNFAITAPPGGFNTAGAPVQGIAAGNDTGLGLMEAMQAAGVLTFASPQYYDWNFYKQPDVVKEITDQWVSGLGEEQVVVGLSANYDYTTSLTLDESEREYNAIVAAHPNIRGAYAWNCTTNLQGGNAWGSAMRQLVHPTSAPAPLSNIKIQAETATMTGTGVGVVTDLAGYEGSGAAGPFSDTGDRLDVTFPNVVAGNYDINFRYATGNGEQVNTVLINGASRSEGFLATGSGWGVMTIPGVSLAGGTNVVSMVKDWGWTYVDYVEIVPAAPRASASTPTHIQAEDGILSGTGISLNTDTPGYEGTSFVGPFSDDGDQLTVKFANVAGGTYAVNIRYAAGGQQNTLLVNGVAQSVFFPDTAGAWAVQTVSGVSLAAGTDTLAIAKDWGFMDVDYIEIVRTGP